MIAYLRAETVKRSAGRSIVASAAYISGEKMTNDYTGLVHDYQSKGGVVISEVLLPNNAPSEYRSAEKLWSSIEMVERSPKAQLGLSVVVALPSEIPENQRVDICREYCQRFVEKGCCVQYALHDPISRDDRGIPINAAGLPAKDPTEHQRVNPHMHILLPYRLLDEQGRWMKKSSCQYIVENIESGETKAMTALELKATGGKWKKQYRYETEDGEHWMTKEQAESVQAKRLDRRPRVTRHGAHVPEAEYICSPEFLHDMRGWWQETVNDWLDAHVPTVTERIDMRSYKDRKTDKIPQYHLGPAAAQIQKEVNRLQAEGKKVASTVLSTLAEINREIRHHNHMVDVYEKQERELEKIDDISRRVAQQLEIYRKEWISARCHDIQITRQIQALEQQTETLRERVTSFDDAVGKIQNNIGRLQSEMLDLQRKFKNTSKVTDRRELEKQITQKEQTIQHGREIIQQLYQSYGYESEDDLIQDRNALRMADGELETKNELLHKVKQSVKESKSRYKQLKERIPVKIRKTITEYQQTYRQQSRGEIAKELVGISSAILMMVEQEVVREVEETEWRERAQER